MSPGIDFSISFPIRVAFLGSVLFPLVLIVISRVAQLVRRNALQFLWSYVLTSLLCMMGLAYGMTSAQFSDSEGLWAGFFLYHAVMIAYLELWALLSRGYTLGLVLTFFKANQPLSINQLANQYRGGEGLDWLIRHRVSGMVAANLLTLPGNQIMLTQRGRLIAFCYKLSVVFFGLRYTG